MNTGRINTLRDVPESFNLDLSNAPKNTKNGPVWVKKLNYYRWSMCHIPYFSPSSFHNVTLYLQFISMLPLHYLFYFTVLSFHLLTHHYFVTYVPPFVLCFLQSLYFILWFFHYSYSFHSTYLIVPFLPFSCDIPIHVIFPHSWYLPLFPCGIFLWLVYSYLCLWLLCTCPTLYIYIHHRNTMFFSL